MRELQPWVEEAAVSDAFEDIAALAGGCRFSNCQHRSEPGCEVLAAIEDGTLSSDRLDHFRQLAAEAAFQERKRNKAAAAEQHRQWKKIHQAQKKLYRERDRSS
jgi:ribosome biogenesis GTPase / thiamine phosphate phosphatase